MECGSFCSLLNGRNLHFLHSFSEQTFVGRSQLAELKGELSQSASLEPMRSATAARTFELLTTIPLRLKPAIEKVAVPLLRETRWT